MRNHFESNRNYQTFVPAQGEASPHSGNTDGHVHVPFKSAARCRGRNRSEEEKANRLYLFFTGLMLLVIGGAMAGRQLELQRTWTPTMGTVIGTEQCDSNSGGDSRSSQPKRPVIEYHVNEANYTVTSDLCSSPHPQVGSDIAVLYDPDDPANGVDASFCNSWLFPIIFLPMGLLLSYLALFGKLISSGNGENYSDRAVRNEFDQALQDAWRDQMERCANNEDANNEAIPFETCEGEFDIEYDDNGRVMSRTIKIQLKNYHGNRGYEVKQLCSGDTKVTKGFVTYSGDAWWVEETFGRIGRGLQIYTVGNFDFINNEFTGSWRTNTGDKGHYVTFKGKNVTKTFSVATNFAHDEEMAQTSQTLNEMLEEDIPIAVAVATPVVQAMAGTPPLILTASAVPVPFALPA